ncbi:MAG: hypothetical protein ACK4MM_03510, partial [Fervidobacterium sp.]
LPLRISEIVEKQINLLKPEIMQHCLRWRKPSFNEWLETAEWLKEFALERSAFAEKLIKSLNQFENNGKNYDK